jgi:pimeloyl-ACP methyl ester carboxylesterase
VTPDVATQQSEGEYVHVNGIDIHYREMGTGEPLVLLNQGMASSSSVWAGNPTAYASFVPAFAARYRVVVPDPRGAGRTVHADGPITYAQLADDVVGLIEALDLERPLLCGFSDGGQTATIVGVRNPDCVRAIVNHAGYDLLNPEAPSMAMARQVFGGSPEATEPNFDAIAGISKQVPELSEMFALMEQDHDAAQGSGHWKTVVGQTFSRITQPTGYTFDDLNTVTPPTLILVGDRDHFCSVEEGVQAYRALANGELAVLPATGHLITPQAVQVAIDFFERQVAGPAT